MVSHKHVSIHDSIYMQNSPFTSIDRARSSGSWCVSVRPTCRHHLVQRGEVDRGGGICSGQAGVETGRDKDRTTASTDGRQVGSQKGNKQVLVERTGNRAADIGEGDLRPTDVIIYKASDVGDERVHIVHDPGAAALAVSVKTQFTDTNPLVSPRPREPSCQLASTVLREEKCV